MQIPLFQFLSFICIKNIYYFLESLLNELKS